MSSRGGSPAAPAPAPGQEPNDEDFEAVNASVPPAASDDEEDVDVNAVAEEMDDDDGAGADAGAVSEDDDQAEDVSRVVLFWGGGWAERESKAAEAREEASIVFSTINVPLLLSIRTPSRRPIAACSSPARCALPRALIAVFGKQKAVRGLEKKHDREDD